MTLCAGWISDDDVFLLIDSAVTLDGKDIAEEVEVSRTTFGEQEYAEGDRVVKEGAAKLFRLGDHFLAAFAGPTEPAFKVLARLRDDLTRGTKI